RGPPFPIALDAASNALHHPAGDRRDLVAAEGRRTARDVLVDDDTRLLAPVRTHAELTHRHAGELVVEPREFDEGATEATALVDDQVADLPESGAVPVDDLGV